MKFPVHSQSLLIKALKYAYCNIVQFHLYTVNIVCSHSCNVYVQKNGMAIAQKLISLMLGGHIENQSQEAHNKKTSVIV